MQAPAPASSFHQQPPQFPQPERLESLEGGVEARIALSTLQGLGVLAEIFSRQIDAAASDRLSAIAARCSFRDWSSLEDAQQAANKAKEAFVSVLESLVSEDIELGAPQPLVGLAEGLYGITMSRLQESHEKEQNSFYLILEELIEREQYDEAIDFARTKALGCSTPPIMVFFHLYVLFSDKGVEDQARRSAQLIKKSHPMDQINLFSHYASRKEFGKMDAALNLIEDDFGRDRALEGICITLFQTGKFDSISSVIGRISNGDDKDMLLVNLAQNFGHQKFFDKAVEYSRLINARGKRDMSFRFLYQLCLQKGLEAEADRMLECIDNPRVKSLVQAHSFF